MPNKKIFLSCVLFFCASVSFAYSDSDKFRYPFYIGLTGGYGSTTWSALVPPPNKAGLALALSTPINVTEGGALWGIFAGYELIPQFAIEMNYMRYASANVFFSEESVFAYENNSTEFTTNTESFSLSGKIMLMLPHTTARVYSSVGVAGVHRYDVLANRWRASPVFGLGLNYNITDRVMVELGTSYTGGYGQSELSPSNDYVPFLYAAFLQLAYRL